MRILNDKCKFICTNNPSIEITVKEQSNKIVKDKQAKILTNQSKCEVKTPLPCPILTASAGGTPTNCQLQQGQWISVSNKLRCKKHAVLTTQSYTQCIYGGIIKPIGTDSISNIKTVQNIQDISRQISNDNNKLDVNANKNHEVNTNKTSDIQQEDDIKKDNTKDTLYIRRNCKHCSDKENCNYFNSSLDIKNNSSTLSKNFKSYRTIEWDNYLSFHEQKNQELKTGNWKIAAHHIISGNQVLMSKNKEGELKYGALIKLANYFQYNINNALNCIMLPTNESNFGQMEKLNKTASAYEVMGYMKRQWHVGGHQYTIDKETLQSMETFYQKYPEQYVSSSTSDFFKNYKLAMEEEMDKLLMKYSRSQCWKKNYHKKQECFLNDLNNLSLKIEKYLLNFGENPKKSFPFFVSKVAVEYAFDLPRTSKIVVIYKSKDSIHAKRIRLERYLKNELEIVPVEKEDIKINDREVFIRFCENVMHFIIDSKLSSYVLPFNQQSNKNLAMRVVDFQDENIMNYFTQHANEMIAFIQQKEFTYQPIAKVVAERM